MRNYYQSLNKYKTKNMKKTRRFRFQISLLHMVASGVQMTVEVFLITKFWAWFIAPLFELPLLGSIETCAIVIFFSYTKIRFNGTRKKKIIKKDTFNSVFKTLAALCALFIGWIMQMYL